MRYLALLAVTAMGCAPGGGGGGGGGAGGGALADAGASDVGGADLGVRAQLEDFCNRAALAKCQWAFECVGGGAIHTKLGLSGPEIEDCAEADAEACLADVIGRFERETLDFAADAVDQCATALRMAPCPGGDPTEWVEAWRRNVHQRCGNVVRGTQGEGDPCETRNDCAAPDRPSHICEFGTCKAAAPSDVMVPCDATGNLPGATNYDGLCPGQTCAALGPNQEGLDGICTIDCSDGAHRCPQGAPCLQLSIQGQAPSWVCTATCTEPAHCENGFSCVKYDANSITEDRHCFVTSEQ